MVSSVRPICAVRFTLSATALLVGSPIFAQVSADNADSRESVLETIVVTGTLIHGQAAPTGGALQTITLDDIKTLGAVDTSQLLSLLPQDASFNTRPQVGGFGPYQTVNAPLLRNLGGNAAGSNSTLLLLDGHRLSGMGVLQTVPDIDAIPPGAIERIEIVPDGGSATYGSDAVGGVLNLITRTRFDGLEIGGHGGVADSYNQWDASLTAGKTWANGSVWVSYDYSQHAMILARDRDFTHNLDYSTSPPRPVSLQCSPGNLEVLALDSSFQLANAIFPVVNGAPTTGDPNRCDDQRLKTYFPSERRHSAMLGLDWDFSDSVNFETKLFYSHRQSFNNNGPSVYSVAAPCPDTVPICGSSPFVISSTVDGNMQPSFGINTRDRTYLNAWGVNPKLTVKLPDDWRLVLFYNYGNGKSSARQSTVDSTALAADVTDGTFNPYTGLFTSDAAGAAAETYQRNFFNYTAGEDEIHNVRAVVDGPLFSLPAGAVRGAVGGEFMRETFTATNESPSTGRRVLSDSRTIKSGFAELSVPIVAEQNNVPLVESFELSASARYDSYSDAGNTFNPRFGANWKVVDWLRLRGNWTKSFQAPSLAEYSNVIPVGAVVIPASTFGGNPAYPNTSGTNIILLYPGGGINLRPQTAKTAEFGADFTPQFLPDLTLSLTWYDIRFKDRIGFPAFFLPSFYTLYPNSYTMNTPASPLTSQQVADFLKNVPASTYNALNLQQYVDNPSTIYALENGLDQNLSQVDTSGIDFDLRYKHQTGFGAVFGRAAGSRVLTYQSKAAPEGSFTGISDNFVTLWRTSVTLGANIRELMAQARWDRTGGYANTPTLTNGGQTRVDAFNTLNLAFQYRPTTADGPLKNLTVTLNIDNVLDADPPLLNQTPGYSQNSFTLGRFIQLGIDKKL